MKSDENMLVSEWENKRDSSVGCTQTQLSFLLQWVYYLKINF